MESDQLETAMRRFVEDLRRRSADAREWSETPDALLAERFIGKYYAYNDAAAMLESEINRVMKGTT